MAYITTRKKLKLQLSPGLVDSYDIQPGNRVGLFWDTKHTLTYFPRTQNGPMSFKGPFHQRQLATTLRLNLS